MGVTIAPFRRASLYAAPAPRVDRAARTVRGFVVAEVGVFESGRGAFDHAGLRRIVSLWPVGGLKVHFGHPGLFAGDGLGKFLGRAHNPRLEGDAVRADLHLDPTAHNTPEGDLAGYVLDLAGSDPDALAASLVLTAGRARPLPGAEAPLWLPTKLYGVDLVDEGDACPNGLFGRRPSLATPRPPAGRKTGPLRRRLDMAERRPL